MEIGFLTDGRARDLDFAAEQGIPVIELSAFLADNFDTYSEVMPRIPAVAAHALQGGPRVATAAMYTNVLHPDEDMRKRNRDAMERMLEACPELDTNVLTIFAGEHPEWSYEQKLDEFERYFGPLIERGQELDVTIAVARCHWMNFASLPGTWMELRRRFPELAFKYDPSHPYMAGVNYVEELAMCASWLAHFHAKDILMIGSKAYEQPPPGLGDIEWGKIMSILHHEGYQGTVCYELHSDYWINTRRYEGILIAYRHLKQFVAPEAEAGG